MQARDVDGDDRGGRLAAQGDDRLDHGGTQPVDVIEVDDDPLGALQECRAQDGAQLLDVS